MSLSSQTLARLTVSTDCRSWTGDLARALGDRAHVRGPEQDLQGNGTALSGCVLRSLDTATCLQVNAMQLVAHTDARNLRASKSRPTGCSQAAYLAAARAFDLQEVGGHPAALDSWLSKSWSRTNIGMCIIMARRLRSLLRRALSAGVSKGLAHGNVGALFRFCVLSSSQLVFSRFGRPSRRDFFLPGPSRSMEDICIICAQLGIALPGFGDRCSFLQCLTARTRLRRRCMLSVQRVLATELTMSVPVGNAYRTKPRRSSRLHKTKSPKHSQANSEDDAEWEEVGPFHGSFELYTQSFQGRFAAYLSLVFHAGMTYLQPLRNHAWS